jgi:hypothetical protein
MKNKFIVPPKNKIIPPTPPRARSGLLLFSIGLVLIGLPIFLSGSKYRENVENSWLVTVVAFSHPWILIFAVSILLGVLSIYFSGRLLGVSKYQYPFEAVIFFKSKEGKK